MEFIYAKELKKSYVAYGNFYNLKYSTGKVIKCRNVLEIHKKENIDDLRISNTPDAIFIMMNPGNSEPKNKKYRIPVINEEDILDNKSINISLILAKPDTTQYQLMRVMEVLGWQHIRVINLSDIREPKSKSFYKIVDEIRQDDPTEIHSIFSADRSRELKRFLNPQPRHVITAWGIDKELEVLIQLATNKKCIKNRIGVSIDEARTYYSHPSPYLKRDKLRWLANIVKKLT